MGIYADVLPTWYVIDYQARGTKTNQFLQKYDPCWKFEVNFSAKLVGYNYNFVLKTCVEKMIHVNEYFSFVDFPQCSLALLR